MHVELTVTSVPTNGQPVRLFKISKLLTVDAAKGGDGRHIVVTNDAEVEKEFIRVSTAKVITDVNSDLQSGDIEQA